jgi:hypothetical protein
MPELYGQPRKDQLRKEIRELSNDLHTEVKKHRETRQSLEAVRAYNALLTNKIQSMEAKLKDVLTEASREISGREIVEERERQWRARVDAIHAEIAAQADAATA